MLTNSQTIQHTDVVADLNEDSTHTRSQRSDNSIPPKGQEALHTIREPRNKSANNRRRSFIRKPFQLRSNIHPWLTSTVWDHGSTLSVSKQVLSGGGRVNKPRHSIKPPVASSQSRNPRLEVRENVRSVWSNRFTIITDQFVDSRQIDDVQNNLNEYHRTSLAMLIFMN